VVDSERYKIFLKPIEDKFQTLIVDDVMFDRGLARPTVQFRLARLLKRLEKNGVRKLLVPSADIFSRHVGYASLWGYRPKEMEIRCGLLLLPIVYPGSTFLRDIKRDLFFKLQRATPITPLYYDAHAVNRVRERFGVELQKLPEPLLGMKGYQPPAPRNDGILCFGNVGLFEVRKGGQLLMEAYQKARFNRPTRLILAGQLHDHQLSRLIEEFQPSDFKQIQVFDQFLTQEKYLGHLSSIDVVCLTYRSHVGPSGVYCQSAVMDKVILASDYGWLGWEAPNNPKIRLFQNESSNSLAQGMEQMAEDFETLRRLKTSYVPVTEESFAQALCGF
jgi:glycosyltransferase involved in cell wall biosynthesis